MTTEQLDRANALRDRSTRLNEQLKELRKLEREPVPFALCSQATTHGVMTDDLPQAARDAVIDALVGAFSREIARAEAELARL